MMRSFWCAVVAVCVLAGSFHAAGPRRGHEVASQLHRAGHAHAAHARPHAPGTHRVGPGLVAISCGDVRRPGSAVALRPSDIHLAPPEAPELVRSSRGPPAV